VLVVVLAATVGTAAVTARRHPVATHVVTLSERPGDLGQGTSGTRASLEEFWCAQLFAWLLLGGGVFALVDAWQRRGQAG
jgi:hypothetical protein